MPSKLFAWVSWSGNLALTILFWLGFLNFEHGLGDLIYGTLISLAFLANSIAIFFLIKKKSTQTNYLLLTFLVLAFQLYIVYSATIGSGPE